MKFLLRKTAWLCIFFLLIGVAIGGYLFSKTIARSFLSIRNCDTQCFNSKEVLGLLSSAGIQRLGGLIPATIAETDKTLAINYPDSLPATHYVIIPKKDVQNVGTLSDEDKEYLIDAFAVMQQLIDENHMVRYRIITNGPGFQKVAYLHFHLIQGTEKDGE
jgi:hypothetical protein